MAHRWRWLSATLLAGLGWLAFACSEAPAPRPLLVAAAVCLAGPLQEIAAAEAPGSRAGPPLQFHFASSGALQQQILQGAPVDVFLSAGQRQMDALQDAGRLLPGSRRELFSNELVLVVPARSSRRTLSFKGLAGPELGLIAIGDSSVPVGDYARQVLSVLGLSAAVAPRLVPLGSARAVAQAVAQGHVQAGLVYRSDAQADDGLRITAAAPAGSHAPIRYLGAVLTSSRNPAAAQAYLRTLAGPPSRERFRRHGFGVPDPSPQP